MIVCLSVLTLIAPAYAKPGTTQASRAEAVVPMDAKPTIVDPTAPENPTGTWNDSDKFVTLKDAHGHEYDARTGDVICLDKPFMFRNSLYGSPSPRKIPLGHSRCISRDREFTTL